ncbi:MAG TPA: hypothetical protein VF618_20890 [Thermoanaerobaculia bacterium]
MTLRERLDVWANPILIKELRQAVRGRFAVSILILALLAQVIAVGVVLIAQNLSGNPSLAVMAGQQTFMALIVTVVTPCMFFIPVYAGFRMAAERNDSNVDLLFITTIKPRTIVLGKLASIFAVVALIFSSALPFLAFAYALRGVDLVTIVLAFGVAMLVVLSVSILALFIASLPATKPFKLLMGIGVFLFTLMMYAPMIAMIAQSVFRRNAFAGEMWTALGTFVASLLLADIVLLVLTTVLITPPAANRALPVRLLFSFMWMLTFVLAVAVALNTADTDPILVWAIVQLVLASLVLASAIGEREEWGPRVARTIPRPMPRRLLAFLFFSGGAGGTVWSALTMAATVLAFNAALLVPATRPASIDDQAQYLLEAAICLLAYAMTALLIRRKLLARRLPQRFTWTIAAALLILIAVVPPIIFLAAHHDTQTFNDYFHLVAIANPVPVPVPDDLPPVRLAVLMLWCGAMLAANRGWFAEQLRRFAPLDRGGEAGVPVLQPE